MLQYLVIALVSFSHSLLRFPKETHYLHVAHHNELPISRTPITFSNFTNQIGYDQRYIENQEELENELTHLVHLHVMYSLYISLSDDSRSIHDKLDKINKYYMTFETQSMLNPNLHSGDLYDHWNFDM